MAAVRLPRRGRIRVVELAGVPAIGADLADAVHAADERVPGRVGPGGPAREAAAEPHDRDRILGHASPDGGRPRPARGGRQASGEEPGDRLDRRVVEDEGPGDGGALARRPRDPVAELDGQERVEPRLEERLPGVERLGPREPEDVGHLGADVFDEGPLALARSDLGQPAREVGGRVRVGPERGLPGGRGPGDDGTMEGGRGRSLRARAPRDEDVLVDPVLG